MCLFFLIALFLIGGVAYARSPAVGSYDRGVAYGSEGKFTKAKEAFERALNIDAAYGPAERSLEIIRDVTEKQIKTKTAKLLFKGASYVNKGRHDKGIRTYTKAIELEPMYAKAYSNRGNAYYKKGQYEQAINDYTKTIELDPMDVDAYFNRGSAYSKRKEYDRAISDYTKAAELNPKDTGIYINRALAYYDKGQYEQAIGDYTKIIKLDPKHAQAYSNRGFLYQEKLGNTVKACADRKKACELGKCKGLNYAKGKGLCS